MTEAAEQAQRMLDLQNELNTFTNRKDVQATGSESWTSLGREWYRAIWMEAAEMMERQPWKWWKSAPESDLEQQQIELVDIWHFLLSMFIEEGVDAQVVADSFFKGEGESFEDQQDAIEGIAAQALNAESSTQIGLKFGRACKAFDLDFNTLYEYYVYKNVLNIFRQKHGYAEGSYRKIWDGEEDNVHLAMLKKRIDDEGTAGEDLYNFVYQALETRYNA
ncbi:MAG: dUTP diphosphatase [Salinisphaeraceae bacterium]|nr:dUTP diphosphatase [Salinisphaeraceae bacterium]